MEYIDKSALVAEIESKIEKLRFNLKICKTENDRKTINLYIGCYNGIISLINTLEVKEVDLDFQTFAKEMDFVFALPSSETKNTEEEPLNWEYAIAKHFYSLRFKAQKGE